MLKGGSVQVKLKKKIRKNVYSKTTELEKTIAMVFIMNLLCIYMNV